MKICIVGHFFENNSQRKTKRNFLRCCIVKIFDFFEEAALSWPVLSRQSACQNTVSAESVVGNTGGRSTECFYGYGQADDAVEISRNGWG